MKNILPPLPDEIRSFAFKIVMKKGKILKINNQFIKGHHAFIAVCFRISK